MARKAIYTEDEAKTRAKERAAKHNAQKATINVRLWPIAKARYKAYADHKGMELATMLQNCVERCMVTDSWTWEPTQEDLAKIEADAAARKAKVLE